MFRKYSMCLTNKYHYLHVYMRNILKIAIILNNVVYLFHDQTCTMKTLIACLMDENQLM